MINKLIQKGVVIPCPMAVVLEDIDTNRIMPGATIYPGTILRGPKTFIGRNAEIGAGGGALIENTLVGPKSKLMQGVYRDAVILNGVTVRNGAEIRGGSLIEDGVELGHTVGLKQTILFPHVVGGSLINFCDALMAGGTSRKNHSEIGSCMALYNFTPQGDKFASIFGDVNRGVFLNQDPIFVGGQTKLISPVRVGYGTVIAAGTKLNHDVGSHRLYSGGIRNIESEYDPYLIWRPDLKIESSFYYIDQLKHLKSWYENVRIPLYEKTENLPLYTAVVDNLKDCIEERRTRLNAFIGRISKSLERHRALDDTREIGCHMRILDIVTKITSPSPSWNFDKIVASARVSLAKGMSYPEAIAALPEEAQQY